MRILVTGASGFLGAWVCKVLSAHKEHEVIAHSFRAKPSSDANTLQLIADLSQPAAVAHLFGSAKPEAVIHAAALSDPNSCEASPELSKRINVDASCHIAMECQQRGIPLIFTSTDLVFDGCKGNYIETDETNPINVYGRHKVEAENNILRLDPSAIIVRLPWMFGTGLSKPAPLSNYLASLTASQIIFGFTDEIRSPVSYQTAATGIVNLLGKAPGMILHFGGREAVSRYEFLRMVASISSNDPSLIQAQKQGEVTFPAQRPADVSLNSSEAYTLGYDVPNLRKMIHDSLANQ